MFGTNNIGDFCDPENKPGDVAMCFVLFFFYVVLARIAVLETE